MNKTKDIKIWGSIKRLKRAGIAIIVTSTLAVKI
jgi:hypothetical protein